MAALRVHTRLHPISLHQRTEGICRTIVGWCFLVHLQALGKFKVESTCHSQTEAALVSFMRTTHSFTPSIQALPSQTHPTTHSHSHVPQFLAFSTVLPLTSLSSLPPSPCRSSFSGPAFHTGRLSLPGVELACLRPCGHIAWPLAESTAITRMQIAA